jgi:hypothetical protein
MSPPPTGPVEAPSLALVAGATILIAGGLLLLLRAALGGWLRAARRHRFVCCSSQAAECGSPARRRAGGRSTRRRAGQELRSSFRPLALLLLLGWAMLRRLKGDGGRLPGALNLASVLLLGFALVQWLAGSGREDTLAPQETEAVAVTGPRPDIYLIVLDGYSRADVLEQYYGFDNRPFLDGLRRRG